MVFLTSYIIQLFTTLVMDILSTISVFLEWKSSLLKGVPKDKHTWMIERLTKSNDACYSNTFIAGGLKWEMKRFPSSTSRGWLNNKKVTGSTGMDFNLTLNRRGNTTGGREGLAHISWFVKNKSNHEKCHETEGED
ncbi:hypothetical protein GIB67_035365 [Kingdonia uniflora]|uniref:MATH domain-containing protein n=1 Tax=Kingdonia uniflora TaxID=39325 RepID=A0A7J7MMR6_9MAGN|nr:hypothetical protein GIB67_035365 [Kingdonia uniflora]